MVRNTDDILEAVNPLFKRPEETEKMEEGSQRSASHYTVEEALVMLHVDENGISLDELVNKTKLSVDKVGEIAITLRMKGFVRLLPGNRIATFPEM